MCRRLVSAGDGAGKGGGQPLRGEKRQGSGEGEEKRRGVVGSRTACVSWKGIVLSPPSSLSHILDLTCFLISELDFVASSSQTKINLLGFFASLDHRDNGSSES